VGTQSSCVLMQEENVTLILVKKSVLLSRCRNLFSITLIEIHHWNVLRITVISSECNGIVVHFMLSILVSDIHSLHIDFNQELCKWSLFVVRTISVVYSSNFGSLSRIYVINIFKREHNHL
jgi:hypothetical protein